MRPQTGRLGQLLTAVVVLWMALLLATDASAQQATAKIVGTITDAQGLVVTGVKITVTNMATNVATETTSDKSGFYQVLNLPIGRYRIVARHEGFRQLEVITAPLEINQSFRADLKLEVGTASERVLVEAQAAGVETVNPTIGQSVTSRPIVNMPLNGRNVLSLALLQPGVTEDNPDNTAGDGLGFSVGGGRSDSITYLLDGGLNNDLLNNAVVYNPNPDSVAEFRILTSDYTAEYGRNGAGVITVVTKSGTNGFHGSAFEFLRNTDFDANSYFNIQAGIPRNNLKRNQFGATFGGPIVKNRLFFFVAYQGQRQIQTDVLPQQQTFTTAELGGDFSQAGPNGGPDPNVVAFLQANPYFSTPADAANGIIDKIDPAAQAYIKTGLIPSNASGEIFPVGGSTNNPYELTAKIDFNITSKDKLTGTIGGNRNPLVQPFGLNNSETAPGLPSTTRVNTSFLNIAYTRTFSPTQLNEFRVTAQRRNILQDKPDINVPSLSNNNSGAATGFGILSDLSNGPPQLYFNDSGLTVGQDPYGPTHLIGNTFGYADTFTWVRGRNTWKFGAGFSAYQQNTLYDYFSDSNFNYYGAGGVGTGNAFADFLVGAPNYLLEGANAANNIRSKSTYGFAQDEWRVRTNLTLTLGIRYEYSTPKTDTKGRSFSIVPGAAVCKISQCAAGPGFSRRPGSASRRQFSGQDELWAANRLCLESGERRQDQPSRRLRNLLRRPQRRRQPAIQWRATVLQRRRPQFPVFPDPFFDHCLELRWPPNRTVVYLVRFAYLQRAMGQLRHAEQQPISVPATQPRYRIQSCDRAVSPVWRIRELSLLREPTPSHALYLPVQLEPPTRSCEKPDDGSQLRGQQLERTDGAEGHQPVPVEWPVRGEWLQPCPNFEREPGDSEYVRQLLRPKPR